MMLTLNNQPYINLDQFLPLDTLPSVEYAASASYDYVHQNCWQKCYTKEMVAYNSNGFAVGRPTTTSGVFALEIMNKTVAPYWVLDLTTGGGGKSCFDSINTPVAEWDAIALRTDLPKEWDEILSWFKRLDCFVKHGRISLLLTRPGIPIHYHIDTGGYDVMRFKPYPHRQEFFWLNMSPEKTVYMLDEDRNPIKLNCRSAFFNHHNWHGSHDALPYWSFSFKVEGVFTQEFRDKIGIGHLENYYYEKSA